MNKSVTESILISGDPILFLRHFTNIYKEIDEKLLQHLKSVDIETDNIIIKTLTVMIIFKDKKYIEVVRYVENEINNLLIGNSRSFDVYIAKIIRFYYLSRKELQMNNDVLFNLLVSNQEFENYETVSVIINCLLDFYISNNIYKKIENKNVTRSEYTKYCFYNGIIELVEGNYEEAYTLLESTIHLSKNKKHSKNITTKKYLILSSLLQSKFDIPVEYDKNLKLYFDLIKIIKKADFEVFYKYVAEHKKELLEDKTYFIILRLSQNVIQERIRCISLIYSKISFDDMSKKLNIDKEDLEQILCESISNGLIGGKIENNIYYADDLKKENKFTFNIKDIKKINESIKSQIKYPEIVPLCYEKVNE